jgi:hypothetical protein
MPQPSKTEDWGTPKFKVIQRPGHPSLQLPDLIDLQTDVLLLPTVESLFGNSYPPTYLHYGHPYLRMLQNCHDLLYRKTLHGKSPFFRLDSAGN